MAIWNERIRSKRQEKGITLAQIADKLGVTEATAQRYESGNIKSIPYEHMCAYGEILGCSPAYLMGWDELVNRSNVVANALKDSVRKIFPNGDADKITGLPDGSWEVILDDNGVKLIIDYFKLNANGKLEAEKRVKELAMISSYTENDTSYELAAAHERTDTEVTDEMNKHDDDIMDDDNF